VVVGSSERHNEREFNKGSGSVADFMCGKILNIEQTISCGGALNFYAL
jgi:hypothetical protein